MGRRDLGAEPATTKRMRAVRRAATGPELKVRAALRRLGVGYRLNVATLPGSPDIANRGLRFAIFVHGCYWHRHEHCSRATIPARNSSFWLEKFRANMARDQRVVEELMSIGYAVHVVWECETVDAASLTANLANFFRSLKLDLDHSE